MSRLEIILFGYPRVLRDGKQLKLERRKTLALIAYLAVVGPCSRETLTAFFWPDLEPAQAAAYLRHALWEIGRVVGEESLAKEGALVGLRFEDGIGCDVREFVQLTAQAGRSGLDPTLVYRLLRNAAALQTEDFLRGFTLKDSPDFDDWQSTQLETLRLQLAQHLERMAEIDAAQGRYNEALQCARRRLALDELDEGSHRLLMHLLDKAGQTNAALRQYEACQQILHEQLGVPPEEETIRLQRQILARERAKAQEPAAAVIAIQARPPAPVFLPAQATQFIGRDEEIEKIHALLAAPECRLLTIVGPGGSGKTRLAIQAAARCNSLSGGQAILFPDGVYYASLAGIMSAAHIPALLAAALRLELHRIGPQTPMGPQAPMGSQALSSEETYGQIAEFLAEKDLLLVLDNLEQLAGQCDSILALLHKSTSLKLLLTSRERLNLPGEWVFELSGLPLPGAEDEAAVRASPAGQLFLKSAQRAGRLSPKTADWPGIARICRMVDGMPLGLELAAAWARMLSPSEIAVELARSLDFLDGAVLAERAGLRAAFEHSWRLLPPALQNIFARLSVFRGGFSRDAALAVAGASPRHLLALSDRSLIRRIASGRFDLHELLKQYAAEKLAAQPLLASETITSHARYFLERMVQCGEMLKGPQLVEAIASLKLEDLNIRLAWQKTLEAGDLHRIGQVIALFILYHEMVGLRDEGDLAMHQLLDALARMGYPAQWDGPRALALAALERPAFDSPELIVNDQTQLETLKLVRQLPDGIEKAYVCLLKGVGLQLIGAQTGLDLLMQSRELFSRLGDAWGRAMATLIAADVAFFTRLNLELARSLYAEACAAFEGMRNPWGAALARNGLAALAELDGRYEDSARLYLAALEVFAGLGDAGRVFQLRHNLGELHVRMGRVAEALSYFHANRDFFTKAGNREMARKYKEYIGQLEMGVKRF